VPQRARQQGRRAAAGAERRRERLQQLQHLVAVQQPAVQAVGAGEQRGEHEQQDDGTGVRAPHDQREQRGGRRHDRPEHERPEPGADGRSRHAALQPGDRDDHQGARQEPDGDRRDAGGHPRARSVRRVTADGVEDRRRDGDLHSEQGGVEGRLVRGRSAPAGGEQSAGHRARSSGRGSSRNSPSTQRQLAQRQRDGLPADLHVHLRRLGQTTSTTAPAASSGDACPGPPARPPPAEHRGEQHARRHGREAPAASRAASPRRRPRQSSTGAPVADAWAVG
jgi:hypothetical protein